ncbi:MAG: polysaccharide biosynthesis protein [Anaerolineae bacterium]|nr:polysaccharide biosynthesis protein [Anaerolineae bacterium]
MTSLRNRHFFLLDLALLPAAVVLSFALRLDMDGMQHYAPAMLLFFALAVPVQLLIFRGLGLYRRFWRYASVDELLLIATAVALSTALTAALLFGLALPLTGIACPRSIPLINGLLVLLAAGGPRFAARFMGRHSQRRERSAHSPQEKPVLIVGAGDAGTMIVREVQANPQLGLVPVGFLDDDTAKHGVEIHGVPVLGGRAEIPAAVRERGAHEVIIAMPTASGHTIRQILDICRDAGVPARTVPGIYDILSGQASVSQIREVEIEDLLRREPVEIDLAEVHRLIRGRCVLVTGAGGSIGSELCRQILRAQPERLILLGHGENSIFSIHNELTRIPNPQSPIPNIVPLIADIRDRPLLDRIFAEHHPDLVFHAAAHKHVPLMEANLCEAVNNNILGTRCLVEAAERYGVSHFILISSDKAVNPTSVMGVTKRVAELLVHHAAQRTGACFAAVRFGNVLGSRGSVVHTFKSQIAAGRTLTVTHPDMRRFFMTIPEAVQLVLQAAALGHGSEVFVLDMGEPVRIVDLALDLVRLSGLTSRVRGDRPAAEAGDDGNWDIEVVFTGIRPGEKLFEELFIPGEEYARTRHEKILVAQNGRSADAKASFPTQIDRLIALAQAGDEHQVRALLCQIVPEYTPPPCGAGPEPAAVPPTT